MENDAEKKTFNPSCWTRLHYKCLHLDYDCHKKFHCEKPEIRLVKLSTKVNRFSTLLEEIYLDLVECKDNIKQTYVLRLSKFLLCHLVHNY